MKLTHVLAALLAIMGSKAGADAFITDGVATGQAKTQVIEFGADHVIMNTSTNYSKFAMADPTHPLNQMSGPCFGVIEVRGGAVEGNGVCVLDGLEGDQVLLGWIARRTDPRGRIHGYWTVNAGKGLWLQASGGGTFSSEVNRANGATTNTIRGAVTLR